LKCLIFDSFYDAYRGVIPHLRIFTGSLKAGDKILVKSTEKVYEIEEVGYFSLGLAQCPVLQAGEVWYAVALIRNAGEIHGGAGYTWFQDGAVHGVLRRLSHRYQRLRQVGRGTGEIQA
jgi:GTP-binding protein LepA